MGTFFLVLAIVLGGLLALAVLAFVLGVLRLRRIRSDHDHLLSEVGALHTSQANLFGQASLGKHQVRGLGTLALTDTEVVFVQLVPRRVLRIPRDSITSTSATRTFLGKTIGRDVLVVTWETDGLGDAAAFDTPEIADWRELLA